MQARRLIAAVVTGVALGATPVVAEAAPRTVDTKCPEFAHFTGPDGQPLCRYPERAVHVTTKNGTVHRVDQWLFPWDVNGTLRDLRNQRANPFLWGRHVSVNRQDARPGRRPVLARNIVRVNVVKIPNSYVVAVPPA